MQKSAFPRIARQLNYTRQFLGPGKSRVNIPGLPYEAFDATGTMIKPQSLLHIFESARAYTFWENTSIHYPDQSMCDMQKLLLSHLVFIVGARVRIQRDFHLYETNKFPLYISTSLTQVGNSSKTLTYELRHAETDAMFASCDVIDVLVDGQTRKPTGYPDWWLEKYQKVCATRKASIPEVFSPGKDSIASTVRVNFSDTDTYRHTNWTSYIKFCYDVLRQSVSKGKFPALAGCVEDGGIKTVEMTYKQESNMGDTLDIISWKNEDDDKCIHFNVLNGEQLCFGCKMDFYAPNNAMNVSRL